MATKITLFILDDNIYTSQEFVERSIYNSKIDAKSLLQLTNSYVWKGQHNLQQLTADILKSNHGQSGDITTYGFTHPSICLDEIDKGLQPDVVIFDWEYGSESYNESNKWLTDILNKTSAFIFVYSQVRDVIPPFLNEQKFNKYANRFQLFLKGDEKNSIFTSEEFIFQYVLSRVSKSNLIKIQGLEISFTENGYLKSPADILHLEKVFGKAFLIEQLKNKDLTITQESIEGIIDSANRKLLFDEKHNFLIATDSTILIDKFKPTKELSYLDVLKTYGLKSLMGVLETGFVKVDSHAKID